MRHLRNLLLLVAYAALGDFRYIYYLQMVLGVRPGFGCSLDERRRTRLVLIKQRFKQTDMYKQLLGQGAMQDDEIEITKDKVIATPKALILGKGKLFPVNTGGSTGRLSTIYKTKKHIALQRAHFMYGMRTFGWLPGMRVVWLWGAAWENDAVSKSITKRLMSSLNNRSIKNAFQFKKRDLESWAQEINAGKFEIVFGYASLIDELARYAADNAIVFRQVKLVVTTAEELQMPQLALRVFSRVVNLYGSREFPFVAAADIGDKLQCDLSQFDFSTNQSGDLLITDLNSDESPLFRYNIGDRAELYDDGEQMFISKIMGRTSAFLKTDKGIEIPSGPISVSIASLGIAFAEWQIVQVSVFELSFKYSLARELENSEIREINLVFYRYFSEKPLIKYFHQDTVHTAPSGKKILILSKV